MKKTIRLSAVDVKILSRKQLEAAYLRLLKVSEMKTALIQFLDKHNKSTKVKENEAPVHVKCPSCDYIIPGTMDKCPVSAKKKDNNSVLPQMNIVDASVRPCSECGNRLRCF